MGWGKFYCAPLPLTHPYPHLIAVHSYCAVRVLNEYVAVDMGVRELMYLRSMLHDDLHIDMPTIPILEDNKPCIYLAEGPTAETGDQELGESPKRSC